MEKTNALRILDGNKIEYKVHEYCADITDGELVAKTVGISPDRTFKTLVTQGNDRNFFVFVVPVNFTLDLKKAAKVAKVKRIEMIKQKDLLPLTGYVHGGCSPIGMKKKFFTVINDTATLFENIAVSAGKKGMQVELSPTALCELVDGIFADIIF